MSRGSVDQRKEGAARALQGLLNPVPKKESKERGLKTGASPRACSGPDPRVQGFIIVLRGKRIVRCRKKKSQKGMAYEALFRRKFSSVEGRGRPGRKTCPAKKERKKEKSWLKAIDLPKVGRAPFEQTAKKKKKKWCSAGGKELPTFLQKKEKTVRKLPGILWDKERWPYFLQGKGAVSPCRRRPRG